MNNKNVLTFTRLLHDLYVIQKLNLYDSFEIMKNSPCCRKNKRLRLSAKDISQSLREGSLLSTSLKKCRYIKFDNTYISFIEFSQVSGNLSESISYLKDREERSQEVFNNLLSALIYPVFVFLLAIAVLFLFFFYGRFLNSTDFFTVDFIKKIALDFLVIFFMALFFLYLLIKNLKENKVYEAFLASGFLIKSGVNVSNSLDYALLILGPASKLGQIFKRIKEKLEFGMDFPTAFRELTLIPAFSAIENLFFLCGQGRGRADLFIKAAELLKIQDDKKRNFCLLLVEPVFIGLTGVFLLTLVMNFFMPVFMNTGLLQAF